ncbi:MAG: glycine--tRNA ligase subunit beta [Desulfotomaculaceae bacterium]|nr:glycine--tRNA ligase subunit beta [Desulfotomaculaceae bacterium]MDD4766540.1 glycine--tRNA ligase subunit beta [Desulfotomaculaceae bacterium]
MVDVSRDFLLEIGVEEMPARFLDPALAELKELAAAALQEHRLSYKSLTACGSPRRIALLVEGMAISQAPLEMEVKGPAVKVAYKDGVPTRAAEGFAAGQGVKVSDLVQKPVGHVDYVFAVRREVGRPAMEVLPAIVPGLITGLHFPKPMRWGDLEFRFARPIRWIVSLFGTDIVEFAFTGLKAGRTTYGHRFLSKKPIDLAEPAEYIETMRKNYVLVGVLERKNEIWRQVCELARSVNGFVEEDEGLLNEVNNLVEYPTALMGEFSLDYLKLPKEVLVTPMREHQRYFPVVDGAGRLMAKFIAVKNGAADHLDIIREGNEKVLRARLADANFFYQEDLKTLLAEKVPELKKIVFQEKLGAVYDKTVRVGEIAAYLAGELGAGQEAKEVALRASSLAKADLVTNMVYEFPELQGYIGREYALRSGEKQTVAEAIFEHYLPRFAGDRLPETMPGKILSISDKIDTIVGCFAIGIQPTGSQDPYALRRQALGISNIILETKASLSLEKLIETSYCCYQGKVQLELPVDKVKEEIAEFFKQRMKGILDERGFSYDTVDAVLCTGYDDLYDVLLRAKALAEFRREPDFAGLLTVFIRANNLSKNADTLQINPALLEDSSEKALYTLLSDVEQKAKSYLEQQDYRSLLGAIATLQAPLDKFFTSVMIMVDDVSVRNNRLALLAKLAALVKQVADLSKVVVNA